MKKRYLPDTPGRFPRILTNDVGPQRTETMLSVLASQVLSGGY